MQTGQVPDANVALSNSTSVPITEMPPQPRNIPQPPNTNFYQNSKQNLKGDLLINFVDYSNPLNVGQSIWDLKDEPESLTSRKIDLLTE